MSKAITRLAAALLTLLPFAAAAEPIQLKLSFFASEQTDDIRTESSRLSMRSTPKAKGWSRSRSIPTARSERWWPSSRAWCSRGWPTSPGSCRARRRIGFPTIKLIELPGLFQDVREGTLAYTHLIAANALRGYQDFFVIGAYTSASHRHP